MPGEVYTKGSVRGRTRLGSLWSFVEQREHSPSSWQRITSVCILIDFNLAARIVGASAGSPDMTGTSLSMPTKALLATDARFVRHQELHEYKTVFWIRFLEIVSRSPAGNEYIQRLRVSTLELDQLANAKIFIILQA